MKPAPTVGSDREENVPICRRLIIDVLPLEQGPMKATLNVGTSFME
jgi:hypothetical protein